MELEFVFVGCKFYAKTDKTIARKVFEVGSKWSIKMSICASELLSVRYALLSPIKGRCKLARVQRTLREICRSLWRSQATIFILIVVVLSLTAFKGAISFAAGANLIISSLPKRNGGFSFLPVDLAS